MLPANFLSFEFEVFPGDDMVVSIYIALSLRGSAMDGEVQAANREKSQKSHKSPKSQGHYRVPPLCLPPYFF